MQLNLDDILGFFQKKLVIKSEGYGQCFVHSLLLLCVSPVSFVPENSRFVPYV